jgi:hypothetical protein
MIVSHSTFTGVDRILCNSEIAGAADVGAWPMNFSIWIRVSSFTFLVCVGVYIVDWLSFEYDGIDEDDGGGWRAVISFLTFWYVACQYSVVNSCINFVAGSTIVATTNGCAGVSSAFSWKPSVKAFRKLALKACTAVLQRLRSSVS